MDFNALSQRPRSQPVCPTKKISVIGSMNMDHIWSMQHFPRVSESIRASAYIHMPGGKGAMQAVACTRLARTGPRDQYRGLSNRRNSIVVREMNPAPPIQDVNIVVEMRGAVGADEAGTTVVHTLYNEGISVEHIIRLRDHLTGQANIHVDAGGRNNVVLFAGANHEWDLDDVRFPEHPVDLVILQLEIKHDTVRHAIREAKKRDASVLLNAAPAENFPYDLYSSIDHLVVNKIEADMLYESDNPKGRRLRPPLPGNASRDTIIKRYRRICKHFLQKGVKNAIITLHNLGGVAGNTLTGIFDWKAAAIEGVVDQTGCGNVFIGAYAVDLMRQSASGRGTDIHRAVHWASKAAGLSVKTQGSLEGIPWARDLEAANQMAEYDPRDHLIRTPGSSVSDDDDEDEDEVFVGAATERDVMGPVRANTGGTTGSYSRPFAVSVAPSTRVDGG